MLYRVNFKEIYNAYKSKKEKVEEETPKIDYDEVHQEYLSYCTTHKCNGKRETDNDMTFDDRLYCKYKDYNKYAIIDGRIPCRDCKMAFTIDYMNKKYNK